MKKLYSCLLVSLSFSVVVPAKTTGISIPNIFPHYGSGAANSPSGNIQSRIIGQTYLKYNGSAFTPIDSTTYGYSFGRGGQLSSDDLNDNFVSFDNSYTYLFDPVQGAYRFQFLRLQEFNQSNKVKKYTCKTWRTSTTSWKDSARFIYTYNTDQTRLELTQFQVYYVTAGAYVPHVDYQNVFDPNGRVVAMNSTAYKMGFAYDMNNNIIERTDSIMIPPQAFTANYKHLFAYNSANQLTAYTIEEHDGVWKSYKKYEYAYTGQNLTTTTEYEWVNSAWTVIGKNDYTYDAADNKLSDIYQTWDQTSSTFVNSTRLQWTYNGFGQPLTYYSESWDVSGGVWTKTSEDFLYRYYYQSFTPTSVGRLTAGSITMLLYPQPAGESLNIRVELGKPEPYTITIFDVQGRMMKQASGSNMTIQQNISVTDLPSGNYFLKLTTSDKQQTRQFVVAH